MRYIYSLVIASFLAIGLTGIASADPSPTYETWTNKSSNIGKKGTPVRVLKLVRYASRDANATSILSGDVVVYDTVSDDGVTVTRTITSADATIAGIAATTIFSADGSSTSAQEDSYHRNWGWIIVHGPATATVTAGGTNGATVGTPFYTSRDEGRVAGMSTGAGADQAAVLRMATSTGGFFQDTPAASDTSVDVFVKLE